MTHNSIQLTMSVTGQTMVVVPCALLVVACEPRNLANVVGYTAAEHSVFAQLANYTFHTTLVKVKVPATTPEWGVYLKPKTINAMSGEIVGFRNETAKQFSLETANGMAENLVTIYQLQGPQPVPWTQGQFLADLQKTLGGLDWWPYGAFDICTDAKGAPITLTTPYFDHFPNAALNAGGPWDYLALQGTLNTVYVHGSTCFESVLQCWQYGGMVLDRMQVAGTLPPDKHAQIAILGAGPSGLLFAHRLQGLGYHNVHIYEATDRVGGKTRTIMMDAPAPPGPPQQTACELGTCYLSPAYDDMMTALAPFTKGNVRQSFFRTASHMDPPNISFRGIATAGQFIGVPVAGPVMDYAEYVFKRGFYEANKPFNDPQNWLALYDTTVMDVEIGLALIKYTALVAGYFGTAMPMPQTPPAGLVDGTYTNFYDFLKQNDLLILCGVLEYAYSVQGYGPLHEIPAYYGLIWISLPLIEGLALDVIGLGTEPAVTFFLKGWLDVWTQMAPTLHITLNADIMSIARGL